MAKDTAKVACGVLRHSCPFHHDCCVCVCVERERERERERGEREERERRGR